MREAKSPSWMRSKLMIFLPLLLLACGACDGTKQRKPVWAVRGQVLFEGRPTPGALVVFHPLSGSDPERPLGYADRDGWFTLSTYGNEDGAPVAHYAVTVTWPDSPAEAAERGIPEDSPNRLPERYSKPETSGLRVQVSAEKNNPAPFQLKK